MCKSLVLVLCDESAQDWECQAVQLLLDPLVPRKTELTPTLLVSGCPAVSLRGYSVASGFPRDGFPVLARQEEKQPSAGSPSRRGSRAGSFHGSPGAGDSEEKGLGPSPAARRLEDSARIGTVQ